MNVLILQKVSLFKFNTEFYCKEFMLSLESILNKKLSKKKN